MSTLLIQSGTLDDIADAIRAKTGKVASMTPLEMPDEIADITGGVNITYQERIIEEGWDDTGEVTYTFDEDIDSCILVLTFTRETTLSDTRYTLTLANGSYTVLEDTGAVVGSTTEERIVYLDVHDIEADDTLYMYNYGDLKTADILTYTEGGGGISILSGTSDPTSSQGTNGQIYLKYGLKGALLHFNSSAIADECGNTWSVIGNATVSSDQSKFGSKSLYLDGDSYIESSVNEVFNFGADDFTISCWVYPTTDSRMAVFAMDNDLRIGTDILFGQHSANMWWSSNGTGWNILQSDTAGNNTGQGTISMNINEWTHIAYVRNGTNVRMYVNGQVAREVTLADPSTVVFFNNNKFRIGAWGNNSYKFVGYIDEFIVTKGLALWTDTFTPPSTEFQLSDFESILQTYAKVNGSWRNLIGSSIEDIDLGSGS